MNSIIKIFVAVLLGIFISSCSSSNPYMVKSTNEYEAVTSKLIGDWGVTSFKVDNKEMIHNKYSKMTANFDFLTRSAKFNIWVSDETISDKLLDWKEKFPGIKVDEYKITYVSNWEVSSDGKYIGLDEGKANLVIKGSGENFDGFYQWEKTKFNMAKSVDDGSLLGSALGSLAKSATGTSDLFPDISSSYKLVKIGENYAFLADNQNDMKLVR